MFRANGLTSQEAKVVFPLIAMYEETFGGLAFFVLNG
jgi:hypothetical protein